MTDIEKIKFLKEAIQVIKGNKEEFAFDRSTVLESLKIDSLDAVELQMYYEEKTGVETQDPSKPVKTVGDLIDLMP
jgi:acyl carrier protein